MDFTKEYQTNISLCTGSRGLERGIERTGLKLRTLVDVEIEAIICENLVQQMEQGLVDEAPIWSNLKTFDGRPFRGLVDILTGGYPCQPFSVAGQRKGKLDPRHLWPFIGGRREASIVGAIRPVCCFFENVPGHLTLGYREVKSDLEALGYKVEEGIFSAAEVGAPQQRKRLFILAVRRDCLENSNSKSNRNNERWIHRKITSTSSKVANNNFIRPQREEINNSRKEYCKEWSGVRLGTLPGRTIKLADSNHNGERTKSGQTESTRQKTKRKKQRQERNETQWERMRPKSGIDSKLANTDSSGSWQNTKQSESRTNCFVEPSFYCWRSISPKIEERQEGDKWPASPGQEQFDWESPRTVITDHAARLLGGYGKKYPESFLPWQIDQVAFDEFTGSVKPSLGMSANGYNFREDVLRIQGNSVVEQTAALAWITLWNKFLK